MWMKYQTYYPYPLHEHFQSPFWAFFEDKENIKIIEEITDAWMKPTHRMYSDNAKTMYMEVLTQSRIWLWTQIKEDWLYVSALFLILRKIWDIFLSRLPNNTFWVKGYDVIVGLLKWWMIHEYYTIGKEWEKMMDILDEQANLKRWGVLEMWNMLVPFDMEEVEPRGEKLELMNLQAKAFDEVSKYVHITNKKITKDIMDDIDRLCIRENNSFKFSKKWIDLLKSANFDEDIIKWFKQIRVKRIFKFNIGLLVAVITAVYFDVELFLYYNPYLYEMWICDKDNLKFEYDNAYIVMNFNNIIKSVFCEHCLEKIIGETKKKLKRVKNIEDNQELIKKMFMDVCDQLVWLCPDDICLTAKGKVKDKNRYKEIEEKIPFGQIWFNKYSWDKQDINFTIEKDLKAYKKKVK